MSVCVRAHDDRALACTQRRGEAAARRRLRLAGDPSRRRNASGAQLATHTHPILLYPSHPITHCDIIMFRGEDRDDNKIRKNGWWRVAG